MSTANSCKLPLAPVGYNSSSTLYQLQLPCEHRSAATYYCCRAGAQLSLAHAPRAPPPPIPNERFVTSPDAAIARIFNPQKRRCSWGRQCVFVPPHRRSRHQRHRSPSTASCASAPSGPPSPSTGGSRRTILMGATEHCVSTHPTYPGHAWARAHTFRPASPPYVQVHNQCRAERQENELPRHLRAPTAARTATTHRPPPQRSATHRHGHASQTSARSDNHATPAREPTHLQLHARHKEANDKLQRLSKGADHLRGQCSARFTTAAAAPRQRAPLRPPQPRCASPAPSISSG